MVDYKKYKLLDGNGDEYLSDVPGQLGGNKRLKIYGRLDCPSANRWIEKGYYVLNRVFFLNEDDAISAGYRPCAVCMPNEYKEWKSNTPKSLVKKDIIKEVNIMNINVRRFKLGDESGVVEVVKKDVLAENIRDYSEIAIQHLVESHNEELIRRRAEAFHCYVIESDEKIIGVGMIGPYWDSLTESSFFTIFIDPELKGNGLGRKIIETLQSDEYYLRADRVEIPASITAVEFYKHFGFGFKKFGHIVDKEGILRMEKYPKISDDNADYNQYIIRPYLDNKYHNYKDYIINLSGLDSEYIDTNSKNIRIIELNGETIGFYEDNIIDDNTFEIKNLVLDSNFRGRGFGRRIIEDFISLYDKDVIVNVDDSLVNYFKNIDFEVIDSVNNKYKMLRKK